MKTWKRITLVSFVLVGSSLTFASWALNQFNDALATLGTPQVATVIRVRPPTLRLGTTTPATTTPATATSTLGQGRQSDSSGRLSVDPPGKGGKVYVGCTYPISWQAPVKVASLETTLFDARTQTAVPAATSRLIKAHTLSAEKLPLQWKIGGVWPGVYYLSISKINGTSLGERSSTFIIYAMPSALGSAEQKSLCESSGGTL
jgi:hypothetical protein